jgi:outer membrane cobalamin receptor
MRQAGSISFACLVTTAALAACVTPAVPRTEPRSRVEIITAEDIAKSAYTNAWDLLRGKARRYDFVEDVFGRPRSIRIRRGRSTINMTGSDTPMILVDGARLTDITALRDLPTDAIESIELMSGIRGTASQGTNSSAGVIYIHTWEASESGSARKKRVLVA